MESYIWQKEKQKSIMRSVIFISITIILFGVLGCQKDYVKLNDDEIKGYI